MGILNDKLTNLGDAIRLKTGGTTPLTLDQMTEAINNLDGSGNNNSNNETFEEGVGEYAVILVDTDATVLGKIYGNKGDIITLPKKPNKDRSSENLEFYDWCCSYTLGTNENGLKTVTIDDSDVVVGALWRLNNGSIMEIELLPFEGTFTFSPYNIWSLLTGAAWVIIDWGDETRESVLWNEYEQMSFSHTYVNKISRKISIYIDENKTTGEGLSVYLEANTPIDENDPTYNSSHDDNMSAFNYPSIIKSIKCSARKFINNAYCGFGPHSLSKCVELSELIVPDVVDFLATTMYGDYNKLRTIFINTYYFGHVDYWGEYTGSNIEYVIIHADAYELGQNYYGFMRNSKIKYFNLPPEIDDMNKAFMDCNRLERAVVHFHGEDNFSGCQYLKEIIFKPNSNNTVVGVKGISNTPRLETITFDEGCTNICLEVSYALDWDNVLPTGLKYINIPSTITVWDGFHYLLSAHNAHLIPNLQIIDLSKLINVPTILDDNGTLNQELLDGGWQPNPTIILRVNKSIIDQWKQHPLWGLFGDRIIGV